MINLPDVTLIVMTSVDYEGHIESLKKSMNGIRYGEIVFASPEKPLNLPETIKWKKCKKYLNIDEYSYGCIYDLHKFVDTEHCLLIQSDSWVLNPEKWNDDWLRYDYIGAPWAYSDFSYVDPFGNHQRVGNGGFSLRSKKLLEVPMKTNVPFEVNLGTFYKHMNANCYNEDGNICVHNRHIFENEGCVFAPIEVAADFSHETDIPEIQGIIPFGFHKNLIHVKKRVNNE